MESPIDLKVKKFKEDNPHRFFIFESLTTKYPLFNPLSIIDTVEEFVDASYLCKTNVCCKCLKDDPSLIITIVNNMPAKYCSLDCLY
jgi:hypothetical protein